MKGGYSISNRTRAKGRKKKHTMKYRKKTKNKK